MSTSESALGVTIIVALFVVLLSPSAVDLGDDGMLGTYIEHTAATKSGETGTVWTPADLAAPTYDDGVDEAFERTLDRNVVFSEVDELAFDTDERIAVIVSPPELVAIAERELQGLPGTVGRDDAALTRRIRAELVATNSEVEIAPLGSLEKSISPNALTRFSWRVRARTADSFDLLFRIYNVARVDGVDHGQEVRAWGRRISVNVGPWERFTLWMGRLAPLEQLLLFLIALGTVYLFVKKVILKRVQRFRNSEG